MTLGSAFGSFPTMRRLSAVTAISCIELCFRSHNLPSSLAARSYKMTASRSLPIRPAHGFAGLLLAADIEALFRCRIANGTFDFDGPAIFRVELNHEVYFCARRTAIEGSSSGGWQRSEDVLDEHSLPACTHHRMPHESFHVADVEERMEQSAIADIDRKSTRLNSSHLGIS